ncbi:hypothetical protein [Flyfo siphovirus Tbat2_3]|nr:hypothetical protein [Flyfo siphovirus Tbat2_3]
MARINITNKPISVVSGAETVPTMLSLEGVKCRIYTGGAPTNSLDGHLVSGGYQIVVQPGVEVFIAKVEAGDSVAVTSPFGV